MAAFLIRALGEQPVFPDSPSFIDVPKNFWDYGEIERLVQLGITKGCFLDPPQFCPGASVTRAQMAVFLARALKLPPLDPPTPSFADVPTEYPAYTSIEALKETGVTRGCRTQPTALYCPDALVNRDQMAVFLQRAFEPTY